MSGKRGNSRMNFNVVTIYMQRSIHILGTHGESLSLKIASSLFQCHWYCLFEWSFLVAAKCGNEMFGEIEGPDYFHGMKLILLDDSISILRLANRFGYDK